MRLVALESYSYNKNCTQSCTRLNNNLFFPVRDGVFVKAGDVNSTSYFDAVEFGMNDDPDMDPVIRHRALVIICRFYVRIVQLQ